ncbi:Uncharacterised protein [Slackia heliotrinireducens]|uniref:hypothetical protein n=1 Tax=Slackia heliotrinireducens TaxID=84110 RepID=UPI0002E343D8|nr:hypothetical protein [Slackia heliotrinireducens]VEG98748.1 Uncharacterised protein [Slackia heliotrinireducens]
MKTVYIGSSYTSVQNTLEQTARKTGLFGFTPLGEVACKRKNGIRFSLDEDKNLHVYRGRLEMLDRQSIEMAKREVDWPRINAKLDAEYRTVMVKRANAYNQKTAAALMVHTDTETVFSTQAFDQMQANDVPGEYVIPPYPEPAPSFETLVPLIRDEAKVIYPGLFKGDEREAYVAANLEPRLAAEQQAWSYRQSAYLADQARVKAAEDARLQQEWADRQAFYQRLRQGDIETVEDAIELKLKLMDCGLPFSVSYDFGGGLMYATVGLPDRELLPNKTAVLLANGKATLVDKTEEQLNQEWVRCLFNIGTYALPTLFNGSPVIQTVIMSGYTDANSGTMRCVYSAAFRRSGMEGLNVAQADPISLFDCADGRFIIGNGWTLGTVTPFTAADL